jgi:hypothetical protein
MMLKPLTRSMMALAPLSLFASAGLAGTPAVLAHVPGDTALYAVIPDVGAMITDLSALNAALAGKLPPDAAGLGMGLFMAQSLTAQPGFNTNGSAAIIINMPEGGMDGAEDPSFTAILPIADLEAFAKSPFMSGQGVTFEDGKAMLKMGPDRLHMADIGDFTVASNDRALVDAFKAGDFMAANTKTLGTSGLSTLDGGDAVLVANVPMMKGMIDEMMAQAEQQANFAAMMGGGDQVTQGFGMLKTAMKAVQEDGSAGLVALDAGGDGLSFDLGVAFREGTPSAAKFVDGSDSGSLLNALPQDKFLLAYAMDSSSEGTGGLISMLTGMANKQGGLNAGMAAMVENSTGTSGMIGSSPAALGGAGLLSKQITYARASDPGKAVKAMRDSVTSLNGESMMGQKFATTYESGAAEVAGVKVDTYSVKSTSDGTGGDAGGAMAMMMDPAMINSMLFGMAGGPSGYVAKVDGGYYSTTSKNSELLSAAIAAGKAGEGLGTNTMIGRVAPRLQQGRFGEAYVALDQAFNTFGPFAQMMGMMDEFEPLEAMPPIGMSVVGKDGGMSGRVFMPADVIGFIAEFTQSMNQGGMMGEDDGPMEPDF